MDQVARDKQAFTPLRSERRRFLKGALAAATLAAAPRRARAQTAETILVVGAGLAGLAAAHRLREGGKRVILVEARDAPGGRVRTIRNYFDDGLHAELGPNRISDTHVYVFHWLNEFGLSPVPFAPSDASPLIVLNGVRARADNEAERERLAADLHADEKRLTPAGLLVKYIEGVPEDLGSPDFDATDPRWLDYDRLTWPDWLRARGASESAIALMMLGGDSTTFSALFLLQQIMLHRAQGPYLKIEGGMDRLPLAIAGGLKNDIRYGCELVRLEHDGSGVRAICREGARMTAIAADRAVLAIPFSTLRRVAVDPPFSPEKSNAIAGLPYHEATRFLLQTRTRFWRAEGLSGSARTNGPADIWDTSYGQPGGRGIIANTTGNAGIDARLAAMTERQRVAFGVDLTKVAFPQLEREVEKVYVQRWVDEPYAKGAFTVFRPGQMTGWSAAMARPEGRIHFAGEHLSPWTGWMEGALWSGERTAQEILQL
jgi:monoamine oxidase